MRMAQTLNFWPSCDWAETLFALIRVTPYRSWRFCFRQSTQF